MTFKIKNEKTLYVGDLGEVFPSKNKEAITVYYILEEDGTKSWQLLPDEMRGDKILKTKKVMPLEYQIFKGELIPKEVLIPLEVSQDRHSDAIRDYLYEEYGFAINSLHLEKIKGRVYAKVDWDTTE